MLNLINTFIGIPLGYIMWTCYRIVKNYGLAIILLTFFTKLILFPISLKVQKNSIKMVKIKPKLDEIAIKYDGDKDMIAEEQMKIYDEEHYSPLAGCLPMLLQLPIILGLINVIYNPLQHLLHVNKNIIVEFINKATDIMSVESLGSSAQLKLVELLHNSSYGDEFKALNVVFPNENIDKIIEQIQNMNTYFFGINLSEIPSIFDIDRGMFIPILAGLSSFLLCYIQNKQNVLQMEQSKKTQWGMTIFMVVFSLYFTLIVPSGVGLYWIFSNIFSILQLFLLNKIYNPKDYIDYSSINKNKIEMKKIKEKNFKQKAKERYNKKREREDYEHFYKIDKKLVFYSEKNGFYKYFENVIKEILIRSDLKIHYVTSDPDDSIFNVSNPRIIPYYIGDKKLIPFMMKMDADIVVMTMPDLQQFHIKRSLVRKDIEYIYMFHYPLSTTMVLRKGALDYYDTIFCVGKFQFDEIRATEQLYGLKPKKLVNCGYGLLENLYNNYKNIKFTERNRKKILIAPSWQKDNILDTCIDNILNNILEKDFDVVIRPHPEYIKRYSERLKGIMQKYLKYTERNLKFEIDFSDSNSIFDSDIVITDWSGTAYEFSFVTKKPCIFIDTPPKINNPEYDKIPLKPLEFTLRDKIGIRIDLNSIGTLTDKINLLIASNEEYKEQITNILNTYISNFGYSGEIGAKYIIDRLKGENLWM